MNLKSIFTGQRLRAYPTTTHNAQVLNTLRDRASDIAPEAQPSVARKSPVDVLLYWTGDYPIPPNSCVKLGDVMIPTSVDPSQPYSDLKFVCRPFEPGDDPDDFAITHGPVQPLGVVSGFIPQASWCKLNVTSESHSRAVPPTTGTAFASATDGHRVYWKPAGTEGLVDAVIKMHAGVDPTSAEPPLRRFELTVSKASTSATATGKFLDDAGNLVGDPVTLYDPQKYFYGKTAGFTSGSLAFRGVALLRRDLATVEGDRWEIVTCERFAQFVVLRYSGEDSEWQLVSPTLIDSNQHAPAEVGGKVLLQDPLGLIPSPSSGNKVIAALVDPDTTQPTYEAIEVKTSTAGSGAGGGFVCSLSGTVSAGSTSACGTVSGTVYGANQGGTLTSLGTRTILNPFSLAITPYSGELFTCTKSYGHDASPGSEETAGDDEFMLMGQEPRQRLASLAGFGAKKSLAVGEGGSAPADIEWLGAECEE